MSPNSLSMSKDTSVTKIANKQTSRKQILEA